MGTLWGQGLPTQSWTDISSTASSPQSCEHGGETEAGGGEVTPPPHSSSAPGLPGWEQDPVSPGLNSDAGSWRRVWPHPTCPKFGPSPGPSATELPRDAGTGPGEPCTAPTGPPARVRPPFAAPPVASPWLYLELFAFVGILHVLLGIHDELCEGPELPHLRGTKGHEREQGFLVPKIPSQHPDASHGATSSTGTGNGDRGARTPGTPRPRGRPDPRGCPDPPRMP